MKDKIAHIINELNSSIEQKEIELSDVVQDAPSIILMMEAAFEKLKVLISEYQFASNIEEITFFKQTKPKLFSKLIYYRKIYYLELNRPIAGFNNNEGYSSLLFYQSNGTGTFFNKEIRWFQNIPISLPTHFEAFNENLK